MKKRIGEVVQEGPAITHRFFLFHKKIIHRSAQLARKCWIPFAILMISFALLISVFRAMTPWAKQYKNEVEQHLSGILGQSVKINSMETSWYWFEPVLKLNQVRVSDAQNTALNLNKMLVGINLFSSLWHWHIQPGILYVDGLQLSLRQQNDHWDVDGLRQDSELTKVNSDTFLPALVWILRQQKIVIKNLSALLHLQDGSLLPISKLNFTAVNHSGHYRLKGSAKLAQTTPTKLLLLADLTIDPTALSKLQGHIYLSIQRFLPAQWQGLFPRMTYHLDNGRGDLEAWFDVKRGHVSGGQTKFQLYRLAWSKAGKSQGQFIQYLQANLAWSLNDDGWELLGDQIKLRSYGQWWPENSLLLKYHKSEQAYRLFVKNLLIKPLVETNIDWPELLEPIISRNPSGQLIDAQLGIKEGQIDYLLGRFSDVSWKQQGAIPGVTHLSGALNWHPTGGRLEFDGEDTALLPEKLPPVIFSQFNGALEWKQLSHGLRVSLERMVLSRPDFVFSARAAFDEPFSPLSRHLQLNAEFSSNHAEKWLPYIPSGYLKPKLERWLQHDIKKIDNVSGQVIINGPLVNFPFDKAPGEFSIVSRFSGMNLFFHKKWPLARDIDTDIRVNKRALEFDVLHANLNEVNVDQVNLRIDDLGLNKETLLLHGQVKAPASKIKSYVFASPLKRHLGRIEALNIADDLSLDVRLEIPLYPENDEVFAEGKITFDDNDLTLPSGLSGLNIHQLVGLLNFNEQGVTNSELKGVLLGNPVAIHLQSIEMPEPATEISLEGNVSIDLLREHFKAPLLSLMQGQTRILNHLILTHDPTGFDHIKMSTDLAGVEISLPPPLGKPFDVTAPLTIDVGLNSGKPRHLQFNYDHRLTSDVWLAEVSGGYELNKGWIQVGGDPVQWKKQKGVQVFGSMAVLDVQKWREKLAKLSSTMAFSDGFIGLQSVEMKLGNIIFGDRNYPNASFNANKLNKETWALQFNQRDVAGNFSYAPGSNTLSGRIKRLLLPKIDKGGNPDNSQPSNLKPTDIPNLNLTIDALQLGDVHVGRMAIKSRSKEGHWTLEDCTITSPSYKVKVKGDWSQLDGRNVTKLQTISETSQLGEVLKRWKINPAVEAHKGSIQLNINWPSTIHQFSLATANGEMFMEFQNGRITHLSQETEEKLGFGKLLSILSLQTIPRRLKLDFSDLSKEGYSFDKFQGNFEIKKGVMSTKNAYIDGPVAYASMKGEIDLLRQLYGLDLHVSPHITASLPIVATIAGGPIAGIAAWVASKIINQTMHEVTGYTYKVSGPWLKPVVQQVSIFKKK
jgi:uncharacterized protein (TIGR02099 family)